MSKFLVVTAAALCCCTACTNFEVWEDLDSVNRDAEFAFPLIDTKVALQDLFDDFDEYSSLLVDSDGLLRFRYVGDTTVRRGQEIFDAINESIPPLLPVTQPVSGLSVESPDSIKIDVIVFKSGQLRYAFQNPYAEPIVVTLTFPQISKDGMLLQRTHPLAPNLPLLPQTFDLQGYALRPLNDSLYITYEVRRLDGSLGTLPPFIMTTHNIGFSYAEGFLGKQVFDNNVDTIGIDFYDNWTNGDVYFERPKVTIHVDNSFGLPTRANVDVFKVITVRGDTLPLESPYVESGFNFAYPVIGQQGTSRQTDFDFDEANSNIEDLLGRGPTALIYDIDVVTNPDDEANFRGFITDSSYFSYYIEVDLPLYGRATNFSVQDTFDVNFSSYADVKQAEFKLVADNQMGLNVALQGYFIDDKGIVVDSLFSGKTILVEAAVVDNEGHVLQPSTKTTFSAFDRERFERIKQVKQLVIQSAFSTYNNGTTSVRILAEQEVNIRLGIKVGL